MAKGQWFRAGYANLMPPHSVKHKVGFLYAKSPINLAHFVSVKNHANYLCEIGHKMVVFT